MRMSLELMSQVYTTCGKELRMQPAPTPDFCWQTLHEMWTRKCYVVTVLLTNPPCWRTELWPFKCCNKTEHRLLVLVKRRGNSFNLQLTWTAFLRHYSTPAGTCQRLRKGALQLEKETFTPKLTWWVVYVTAAGIPSSWTSSQQARQVARHVGQSNMTSCKRWGRRLKCLVPFQFSLGTRSSDLHTVSGSLAWPDPIPHRGKGSGIWP